jgi:hypothetical protein
MEGCVRRRRRSTPRHAEDHVEACWLADMGDLPVVEIVGRVDAATRDALADVEERITHLGSRIMTRFDPEDGRSWPRCRTRSAGHPAPR